MKLLILLFAISRLCESSLYADPAYRGVRVGYNPYAAPVNSHSAYLSQDNHGHYAYGYASALSAQDEVKTPDGVTRGGYSYIDANGILQTVHYVSDPVNGFRVAATNLPKDVPEVAAARAQHLAQFEYIKAEHAAIAASRGEAVISPVPHEGYVVPVRQHVPVQQVVPVAQAQAVPVAYQPVVQLSTQYQAQDALGQYSYGYADPNSAKSETKTADGVTRGGYSYIDANGILQTVQYVSDPVNGFRVAATNLPQAPSVTLIGPKVTATVVGPTETAATVTGPVVQNDVPVVSHGPGPVLHSNPNNQPIAIVPNSELPAPFYPQYAPSAVPVHTHAVVPQQPVYAHPAPLDHGPHYANNYNIPHPDGGAIFVSHPSQVLTAPEVPPHYRGVLVAPNQGHAPNQYVPENRGQVYVNPNIQVPESYQGLGQIVVEDPRDEVSHDGRGQIPHGQIVAQGPHRQILAPGPHGQILAQGPYGQIPHGQIVAQDPHGQISHGPIIAQGPHGQILAQGPQEQIPYGPIVAQDPHGQISHGPIAVQGLHNQIPYGVVSQDPHGQIVAQGPQGQIVAQGPHGRIAATDPRSFIVDEDPTAIEPRGQLFVADERGHLVPADPRLSLARGPNGEIVAQGPDGQIVAVSRQYEQDPRSQILNHQSQYVDDSRSQLVAQGPQGQILNDPRLLVSDPRQQYVEDPRQIAEQQGQILQDVQGQIANQQSQLAIPQGEAQGNYLLGVSGGQDGPSRVGLFSPSGQEVQDQRSPLLVRVENGGRENERQEDDRNAPNPGYSLDIQY